MRSRTLVLMVAALAPVISACTGGADNSSKSANVAQAGGPAKTDKAADEAAIRAIYQTFPSFFYVGDAAGFVAVFADDGVEIAAGAPVAKGRDAIQKMYSGLFSSMKNANVTFGNLSVRVADAGDFATVEGPYQMSFTDAKGKKQQDHGTTLTVFQKINGAWKILYDTALSEVAPSGS
jgi:uncharacterized protein (TIGR02246 family)